MAKRRERLEVIHDILFVIQKHDKIKPTPLLRYSNLSSQRFAGYIEEVLEKKLVEEKTDNKGRKYYSLTENGFKFIEKYQMIVGFLDDFDL